MWLRVLVSMYDVAFALQLGRLSERLSYESAQLDRRPQDLPQDAEQ